MISRLEEPRALLHEAVAHRLADMIERGVLRPGERIPSVRRTSAQHQVSVSTVVQAYLALENRGLIEARPKSGFYVRFRRLEALPEPQPSAPRATASTLPVRTPFLNVVTAVSHADIVPLGAAIPAPELLPVQKLHRIMAMMARREPMRAINYAMPPGVEALRRQVARRALDGGCQLSSDDVVTTNGCSEALLLALRATTKPGDVVAIESPVYYGLLRLLADLGLRAVEIPTHPRHGMEIDALALALRRSAVKAVLVVSNCSNPLGSCMPTAKKQELVALLAKHDLPLIEDDIYGDLHFGPERPRVARAFDRAGRVLLCSSFSKTLAPGYRVGWIAPGRYLEQVLELKFTYSFASATLPQMAVAEFLQNGGYDHHLRTLRRVYAAQVQQVSEAVADCFPAGTKITRPAGGFVLWVEMPKKVDCLKLQQAALDERISITPGTLFSAQARYGNCLRLSCGHPWSPRIERALGVLGHLAKQQV